MNSSILLGRFTKDPELRMTASNTAIVSFTLAVDRAKKDSGADFINCKAFGKQAECISKYFHKGSRILIEGHINTGSYEKDGRKVYTTEVNVDRLHFVDSHTSEGTNSVDESREYVKPVPITVLPDDEELPF